MGGESTYNIIFRWLLRFAQSLFFLAAAMPISYFLYFEFFGRYSGISLSLSIGVSVFVLLVAWLSFKSPGFSGIIALLTSPVLFGIYMFVGLWNNWRGLQFFLCALAISYLLGALLSIIYAMFHDRPPRHPEDIPYDALSRKNGYDSNRFRPPFM